MTATMSTAAYGSRTSSHRSVEAAQRPCGCATCEDQPCSLECLVRPRFFEGQLLTDRDLNAMLDWVRDKQRLVRYRDGWGVVCGLDLWCDPDRPGGILIGPGYAITCCGDDVVVCEASPYDLRRPCCGGRDPDCGCRTRRRADAGGDGPTSTTYDIVLRYAEKPTDPRPALRPGCGPTRGSCDFGQTRESFEVQCLAANGDPRDQAVERWLDEYDEALEIVRWFQGGRLDVFEADTGRIRGERAAWIRRHLVEALKRQPLRRCCGIRDEICEIVDSVDPAMVLRWLLLIVIDRRIAFLGLCPDRCGCDEHGGVTLGRVTVDTTGGDCRITCIDPTPPYRRELERNAHPARAGGYNAGGVIGHEVLGALDRLRADGIRVSGTVDLIDGELRSADELRTILETGMVILDRGTTWKARTWADPCCDEQRVVDFVPDGGRDKDLPPETPDPEVPVEDARPVAEARQDDLTPIKGVGQVRAQRLFDADIRTMRQLADADPAVILKAVPNLSPNEAQRWQEDARDRLR